MTSNQLASFPFVFVNAAGRAAARLLIEETQTVADADHRRKRAMEILKNPDYVTPGPEGLFVDLGVSFRTQLHAARYMAGFVEILGEEHRHDPAFITFFLLAYIGEFVGPTANAVDNYFVHERSTSSNGKLGTLRNYRNPLYVPLSIYWHHRDDEQLCKLLLSGPAREVSQMCERIAQRPVILQSRGAVELIAGMFINPKTGRYHARASAKDKNANEAIKELCVIMFSQCARNFDVACMSAEQLFALVPNTVGLKQYKRHFKNWLALRTKPEEQDVASAA